MGKPCDPAKERYWRRVVRRQAASGLGIGRFCEREGIAADRFYWWRRTLGERDRGRGSVAGRGGSVPPLMDRQRRCRGTESPFLPLPLTVSLSAPIEIVHPRGHVVRLGAGVDEMFLARLLALLDTPVATAPEA